MKILIRDDTEHGVEYVTRVDAEREIKAWHQKAAHATEGRNEAIRILRVLKGDIDHLGHWIPDPCRELVEQFLSENDEMTSPHEPEA